MDKKIQILQIGLDSHLGGIETYLLKLATHLDKEKYSFSFLGYKGSKPCFQDELEELGCKFYFITPRKDNYITYLRELKQLLVINHFDILHCNMNSLSNFEPILIGLKAKASILVHSHNGANIGSKKTKLLNYLGQKILPQKKVTCIAVSDLAGEWMFGKGHDFIVLNNGLDTDKYQYNQEARREIRDELHIGEKEMILHVGAFRIQKNHKKLIEIFRAYHSIHQDSVLVLAGDGELKAEIMAMVKACKLNDAVMFVGNRNDIPKILSAADIFMLPSFYEGFPNVLIEAETSGLYCVVADTITRQANIGGLCKYVSLQAPIDTWVRALEGKHDIKRMSCSELVKAAGLDIDGEMRRLYAVYYKCLEKRVR